MPKRTEVVVAGGLELDPRRRDPYRTERAEALRKLEALAREFGVAPGDSLVSSARETLIRILSRGPDYGLDSARNVIARVRAQLERSTARKAALGPLGDVVRVKAEAALISCDRGHKIRSRFRFLGTDGGDRCPACLPLDLRTGRALMLVGAEELPDELRDLREAAAVALERERARVAATAAN